MDAIVLDNVVDGGGDGLCGNECGVVGEKKRVRRSRKCSKEQGTEDGEGEVLSPEEADKVFSGQWCVPDLKRMCRHYKLKVGGTKPVLQERLYVHLRGRIAAATLETFIKRRLAQEWVLCHGPGLFDRSILTNDVDFATLDSVNELGLDMGFSFREGNSCFMFDIESFQELLKDACSTQAFQGRRSNMLYPVRKIKNPFTRVVIDKQVIGTFRTLLTLGTVFGRPRLTVDLSGMCDVKGNGYNGTSANDSEQAISDMESNLTYGQRLSRVFDVIDSYGHYSNPEWLLLLSREGMRTFIVRLYDIVFYRVGLTQQALRDILPPSGQFLELVTFRSWVREMENAAPSEMREMLENMVVLMCNRLVRGGVDQASRELGTMYVLMACTIVSNEARAAMPWLYDSLGAV
jgi:hypothetical protein